MFNIIDKLRTIRVSTKSKKSKKGLVVGAIRHFPVPHPFGAAVTLFRRSIFASCKIVTPLRGLKLPTVKTKKPPVGRSFVLMVEAAGVEPASASTLPSALHVYSIY